MKAYCRACRAPLADGASFCHACGARLGEHPAAPAMLCAACGGTLTPAARFCRGCGAPVAAADSTVAPETLASVAVPPIPAPPAQRARGDAAAEGPRGRSGTAAIGGAGRSQPAPESAPSAAPAGGLGKPLLGLGAIALLALLVWQWTFQEEDATALRTSDWSGAERVSPAAPATSARPSATPLDVEGIEGIVDIDEPEPLRAAPGSAVGEATARLPELAAKARSGDRRAMTSLALAQRAGLAGRADPLAAIALLERAAAAGDAHALATLADEYEAGIWIAQDTSKARALRLQAAKAGSRLAQWELEP